MISRPEILDKLFQVLRSLPSVGPKMSERIAFYLLNSSEEQIKNLLETVEEAYEKVRPCFICGYWDDSSPCRICEDSSRDKTLLCVVETPQDLVAMSRIRNFAGYYHVLGGALSPLDGIGPQDLRIMPLMKRLETGEFKEIVLALNPDTEGETTVHYLIKQIHALYEKLKAENPEKSLEIKITRLAQGLPAGGELEYMDEVTLMRAFNGRRSLEALES